MDHWWIAQSLKSKLSLAFQSSRTVSSIPQTTNYAWVTALVSFQEDINTLFRLLLQVDCERGRECDSGYQSTYHYTEKNGSHRIGRLSYNLFNTMLRVSKEGSFTVRRYFLDCIQVMFFVFSVFWLQMYFGWPFVRLKYHVVFEIYALYVNADRK